MESTTKKLDMWTLREEQRVICYFLYSHYCSLNLLQFIELRDAVYKQDAAVVQAFQNLRLCHGENMNM